MEIKTGKRQGLICLIVVILAVAAMSGCSMRKMAIGQVADIMETGHAAFLKDDDPELVRDAMAANLKMIEAFLENDPDNPDLLLMASQGFSAHAFMFIEQENPARAIRLYERGRKYGLKMLTRRGLVPQNQFDLDEWDRALAKAKKDDVPALFWTAFAWGGRIQLDRESPAALADMPFVIRLVEEAARLDPGYWFAGPETFLGFYHGSVPVPIGGQPHLSKAHFERALSLTGRQSRMIQVLYARSYAVQVQDRNLFESLLAEAAACEGSTIPETTLSNAIARERAAALLEQVNDLFAEEVPLETDHL